MNNTDELSDHGRSILLKNQARKRGDTFYFTGKACKHGHIAKRRLNDGACVPCSRERHWRKRGAPMPTRPEPTHCELCGKSPHRASLDLAHDHVSGVFRGWLCHSCNRGLGLLGDSLEMMTKAVLYLKQTHKEDA